MIRGTNQDFKFKMPYEYKDVPLITVTFWQKGNDGPEESRPLPIIKYHDDCEPSKDNNKEITVTLLPEETARFVDDRKAYVQLTGTTTSGIRFGNSPPREITVYPIHNDAVLGDVVPPSENNGLIILDGGDI